MHGTLRSVCTFATLFLLALAGPARAADPQPGMLTVAFDFQGPHSPQAVDAMEREAAGILKDSGLTLNWRTLDQASGADYANLVVVRFKGKCILEPIPILYDERGPLAFTHTADGKLLPFSEVACDQVTATMRTAMFGGDYADADQLLGRALGRVVAHELVHILTGSSTHGAEGVFEPSLSGRQLIGKKLSLSSPDLERLHETQTR